jgi:hypothetical protein
MSGHGGRQIKPASFRIAWIAITSGAGSDDLHVAKSHSAIKDSALWHCGANTGWICSLTLKKHI